MAQAVKHLATMWETQFQTLGWEDPLEKAMATHSSILAWRIPWPGAWWATVHRVAKSRAQLKRLSMHTKDEEHLGQEHGSKNGEEI